MRNWSKVTWKINKVMLLVLLTVLFLCNFNPVAEATIEQQRVVVVNIEGVELAKTIGQSQLQNNINEWALGFLIKDEQVFAANKLFLDLGSNSNVNAGEEPLEIVENRQILNNRFGKDIIFSRTGLLLQDSQAGVVDWPKLRNRGNDNLGFLAEELAKAGITTAYAGGLPRDQLVWRPGALLLANTDGIVPWVHNDPDFQIGELEPFIKAQSAGVMVVDLAVGNTNQLQSLLQQLSRLAESDLTVILTFLSEQANEGHIFFPILIKEPGQDANLIISGSTRRTGLINTSDLHNYIIGKAVSNIDTIEFIEHEQETNWQVFERLKQQMVWINTHRTQLCVLMGFIWFAHILMLIWPRTASVGLAGAVASPLLGIIWSTTWLNGMPAVWFSLIIFELVILLLGALIPSKEKLISVLMLTFLGLLSVDQIGKGFISSLSVWGPDAIIGVRYYGLGNELLAFALVSLVWLLTRLRYRSRQWPFLIMPLALWVIVMAFSPRFGANFGAGLVLVATTLYWALNQAYTRLKWRYLVLVLVLAFSTLALWSVVESTWFHNANHISKAIMNLVDNRYGAVFDIILAKLAIYQRVLGVSHGVELFFVSFLAGAFVFSASAKWVEQQVGQQQFTFYQTLLFGSVLALLVNDTGIVTVILVILQVLGIGLGYRLYKDAELPQQFSANMHNSV